MTSLSARIEELERREPDSKAVTIILRSLVRPGEEPGPIVRLRDTRTSRCWTRNEGEDEDAFTTRAVLDLNAPHGAVVCLVGDSAGDTDHGK